MKPNYIIFLLDEDGKHPLVIAGGAALDLMQDIYDSRVREYGSRRVHLRRVSKPSAIWAATDPV